MTSVIGPRRAKDVEGLQRVVSAARECFERFGVSKTRMHDVAEAAEMPRPYVYEHVTGKEELVELALLERAAEFRETIERALPKKPTDVEKALLDTLAACIEIARHDREFGYLAEAIPRSRINYLLTAKESPVHDAVRGVFDPLFEIARARDQLRTEVSETGMAEWIQGAMTWLTPRVDLKDEELRELLRDFALPAILRDP